MSKQLLRGLAVGSWALAALVYWYLPALTNDPLTADTTDWLNHSPGVQREVEFYRGQSTGLRSE